MNQTIYWVEHYTSDTTEQTTKRDRKLVVAPSIQNAIDIVESQNTHDHFTSDDPTKIATEANYEGNHVTKSDTLYTVTHYIWDGVAYIQVKTIVVAPSIQNAIELIEQTESHDHFRSENPEECVQEADYLQ